MRLLVVVAAVLVAASAASLSLEDLEFRAWKLKFGKTIETCPFLFDIKWFRRRHSLAALH